MRAGHRRPPLAGSHAGSLCCGRARVLPSCRLLHAPTSPKTHTRNHRKQGARTGLGRPVSASLGCDAPPPSPPHRENEASRAAGGEMPLRPTAEGPGPPRLPGLGLSGADADSAAPRAGRAPRRVGPRLQAPSPRVAVAPGGPGMLGAGLRAEVGGFLPLWKRWVACQGPGGHVHVLCPELLHMCLREQGRRWGAAARGTGQPGTTPTLTARQSLAAWPGRTRQGALSPGDSGGGQLPHKGQELAHRGAVHPTVTVTAGPAGQLLTCPLTFVAWPTWHWGRSF